MAIKTWVRTSEPNCYEALSPEGEVMGVAFRSGAGHDWTIAKIQWRGANGHGKVAGYPGGKMTIGTVSANCSTFLQHKLITAMLEAL